MSSQSNPRRPNRPIGLVLPVMVIGIGVIAVVNAIPKDRTVWQLRTSGVTVASKIVGIQHSGKSSTLTLGYQVDGVDHEAALSMPDDQFYRLRPGQTIDVTYLRSDPNTSTTDLAKDTKLAVGYSVAGFLDLFVGFFVVRAAVRQRRRLS